MSAFDTAWALLKEETTCPLCNESGSGEWFFNHYEDCANRHIQDNSPNVDFGDNEEKRKLQGVFDSIEGMGVPIDDLRGVADEMPDIVPKYSGFKGIDSKTSDDLWAAQESAMIDAMYQSGTLGRHPDQKVVTDDTTRRVGLWMDNDEGLYYDRKDWVKERFDSDDIDARGFGEYMAELLQNSPVHEELEENERTWDDVDWDSILDDEHQVQIDAFYDGIAGGEYHHDDETGESDDWIYRDYHVDDEEHAQKLHSAKSSRAHSRINRLVHDSIPPEQRYEQGFNDVFSRAWDEMIQQLQDPSYRESVGIEPDHLDSYMIDYHKRKGER